MRPRDVVELLALAALWGGSFLFMRVAVPEFGPVALSALRVAGASLLLIPLLAMRGQLGTMAAHWPAILAVGVFNSALPFMAFAYATQSIEAGIAAILNSATPLSAAVVAWVWLGDRLTAARIAGLVIGFAGVVWITWLKTGFAGVNEVLAVAACLAGTLCYAIVPSLTQRYLRGVAPLAVATGSQVAAALVLALPAMWLWPAAPVSIAAWATCAALAFACTGLAYILYFRLIANAGPQNAVSVTYLVPIFAVAWGGTFLGERLTMPIALGCAVVFLGTALATGMLRLPVRRPPAPIS